MEPRPNEFIPTRASLLDRLKDWEDQDSWQEFFTLYRKLIFSAAMRAGLSEQESEDVVQETVLSVAKTIKAFQYDRSRCTFKSWLRHLTQKRIADQFRKRPREAADRHPAEVHADGTATAERVPDPASLNLDAIWEEEWQQTVFQAAVAEVKQHVNPEQFQAFDFYVLRKMPVKKVAAALDLSVAGVYLAKHRVLKLIQKEAKRLEQRMS